MLQKHWTFDEFLQLWFGKDLDYRNQFSETPKTLSVLWIQKLLPGGSRFKMPVFSEV